MLVVAALVVGVVCGYLLRTTTEHSGPARGATTTITSVGIPSSAATTPSGMGYGPATAPVDRPVTEAAVFAGARAWPVPGIGQDVVELAFRTAPPACVARYVARPAAAQVSGAAFLELRCPGVSGYSSTGVSAELGSALEPGRTRFASPTTKNVIEVVQTGYEHHVLSWIIGLRRRAPMGVALIESSPSWVSVYIMA